MSARGPGLLLVERVDLTQRDRETETDMDQARQFSPVRRLRFSVSRCENAAAREATESSDRSQRQTAPVASVAVKSNVTSPVGVPGGGFADARTHASSCAYAHWPGAIGSRHDQRQMRSESRCTTKNATTS
jgi:hypothetical protein